ncbi:hypothetical protein AB6H32_10035 [Providencia hangzhouensis]
MTEATNYWLAGASWDGCDHQDKTFIENKIWVLGYKKMKMKLNIKEQKK